MKNVFYKACLLAALGFVGATAAQAQINANDLVLGFTSQASGVSDDYLVDLGQLPTTPNTALNVSGFSWTTFSSIFGSALANGQVNAGIVGSTPGNTGDVILSQLDNGTGTASIAGSATPPGDTLSGLHDAASTVSSTSLTLGEVAQSQTTSFYYNIAENPTTVGAAGISSFSAYADNPLVTISSSESVVLDIYEDSYTSRSNNGWSYDGTVTLNLSGDSLSAVYDVTPTPEPSTCVLGGLGMLMLVVRRKWSGKLA
ncbi:MAG TPA: PEP-CTERM sorting domain-containing protein [Candidatus Sulfotelmatobacter sp.]|nr:PEP-CTERM sorting domain-containing protein [Candidatus Sulfotelmatobacter sp.]